MATLAVAAIAIASCTAAEDPCADMVCLSYGNGGEVSSLDPQQAEVIPDFVIAGDLMMGLVTEAADGQVIPGIAERWEASPDGLVWHFYLRPAMWSDGRPVTAEDFVFAFRRAVGKETQASDTVPLFVLKNASEVNAGGQDASALGARAVNERTLELTLEHPAPHFTRLLTLPAYYPLPAHTVGPLGKRWTEPGAHVSNGPFRLVSWRLGDKIRVEKNPRFWDAARVCIDRIDYFPTTDAVTAERQIRAGELDISTTFQSSRIKMLRSDRRLAPYVRSAPQLSTSYIAMNQSSVPALRDVRVRQALSEAIDRDFIAYKVLGAGQRPADALVPVGVANYPGGARASWADRPLELRRREARKLLATAGYGPDRPLRITLKAGSAADADQVAQALASDWRAVGLDVTTVSRERQVLRAELRARDFELALTGWAADVNDATTFLDLMRSENVGQNYGGYRNPVYDALVAEARSEVDIQKRAKALRRAEDLLMKDQPFAPVYQGASRNLVSPAISGWVDNAADVHRARWLCRADSQ